MVVEIVAAGIPQKEIVSSGFVKAIAVDVLALTIPPLTCAESPLDHATATLVFPTNALELIKVDNVVAAALIGARMLTSLWSIPTLSAPETEADAETLPGDLKTLKLSVLLSNSTMSVPLLG